MKERNRQYVHMILSIILLLFLLFLGRIATMVLLFAALVIGTLLINRKILGEKVPVIDEILETFERKNTRFAGYGSAWFIAGCLFSVTFLSDINQIISIIWILGIGDGVSTLVGRMGRNKLPYNKDKTIEGSVAFFLSSLPAYFLIGNYIFPLAFLCALTESLKLPIDDNASIPIIGTVFLRLVI